MEPLALIQSDGTLHFSAEFTHELKEANEWTLLHSTDLRHNINRHAFIKCREFFFPISVGIHCKAMAAAIPMYVRLRNAPRWGDLERSAIADARSSIMRQVGLSLGKLQVVSQPRSEPPAATHCTAYSPHTYAFKKVLDGNTLQPQPHVRGKEGRELRGIGELGKNATQHLLFNNIILRQTRPFCPRAPGPRPSQAPGCHRVSPEVQALQQHTSLESRQGTTHEPASSTAASQQRADGKCPLSPSTPRPHSTHQPILARPRPGEALARHPRALTSRGPARNQRRRASNRGPFRLCPNRPAVGSFSPKGAGDSRGGHNDATACEGRSRVGGVGGGKIGNSMRVGPVAALFKRQKGPKGDAGVELARPRDALARVQEGLVPLCEPATCASHSEEDGEHVRWDAQRPQDDARVEVDVGVKLALDKVLVAERDGLEAAGQGEIGVGGHVETREDLLADALHQLGARRGHPAAPMPPHPVPKAHQPERVVLVLCALDELGDVLLGTDLAEHA
eukprot:scaffold11940_cov106-Isochrysis_galbana.AAC.2